MRKIFSVDKTIVLPFADKAVKQIASLIVLLEIGGLKRSNEVTSARSAHVEVVELLLPLGLTGVIGGVGSGFCIADGWRLSSSSSRSKSVILECNTAKSLNVSPAVGTMLVQTWQCWGGSRSSDVGLALVPTGSVMVDCSAVAVAAASCSFPLRPSCSVPSISVPLIFAISSAVRLDRLVTS